MSTCFYLKKRFAYFIMLLAICLCSTARCVTHKKAQPHAIIGKTSPIYLVAREPSKAQIYQISPDDGSSSIVYEIAEGIDRPVGDVFPPSEIKKLQSYLVVHSSSVTTTMDSIFSNPYIERLTLSPTGEMLAWIEGDTYCVDGSAICFGVKRLMVLDLNTNTARNLLQIPSHSDEDFIYYISGGPTWSPDGQYIAIIRSAKDVPSEALLIVTNVSTEQRRETMGTIDSGAPLVWAPDKSTLAWKLSRWHTRSSGGAIRLCVFQTDECKDIEFDGLWIWNWSMDWSPDGEWIVFAAKQKDSDVFSSDARIGLHLLDPRTGLIQDIPVNVGGMLENPRWSPDGQLLAADYRSRADNFFQSLLVIEPTSGQVVSQLSTQRAVSSWAWGDDSHSILVLTGTDRTQLEVGILDVRTGSLQNVMLPDELATKQINYLDW